MTHGASRKVNDGTLRAVARLPQLLGLFRSLGEGDLPSARRAADAILADEEKRGNHVAARRLKGALRKMSDHATHANGHRQIGTLLPPPALFEMPPLSGGLSSVVLRRENRVELDDIVMEWRKRRVLESKSLTRRSRVIFHGPPGCGKSLSATALAAELGLPLYVVRFDALVGAYLGQTAVQLRQVFQFAEETPCVLLLDEIDALGKARGNPSDVGELDRIVISLMQELEHSHPSGLIVATSNLPGRLDRALWRRFDLAVVFPRPSKGQRLAYARDLAQRHGLRASPTTMSQVGRLQSFADVTQLIENAARKQALAD